MNMRGFLSVAFAFGAMQWSCPAASSETVHLAIFGAGKPITGAAEILPKYAPHPTDAQYEKAAAEMQAARVILRPHQKLQLSVLRTTGLGAPKDITRSSHVIYSSADPWLVTVNKSGLISVVPTPGFEAPEKLSEATKNFVRVTILYGTKAGLTGSNVIFLKVEE